MTKTPGFHRLLLVVAALSLALPACTTGDSPAPGPVAVVLVTVDALRPDLVSTWGGEISVPALDRLASRGTVYRDVLTVVPMTRPALATIMTGVGPDEHRVLDDVTDRLGSTRVTLAEAATRTGFETAAFVSSPMASWSSGLQRGFHVFDGPEDVFIGPARYFPAPTPGAAVAERFSSWLESVPGEQPFFAWVHLADLHGVASVVPSPGYRDYQDKVPVLDEPLQLILDAVETRSANRPVEIILVGTHGTRVYGEGSAGASFWLTMETLRVPLVRARFGPGAAAEAREDLGRRWLPDVHATLIGLLTGQGSIATDGVPLGEPAARVALRVRRAWTWATDDELAWPTLTAVESGGNLGVFSQRQLESTGSASDDPLRSAAAERPATPRRRDLSDATRGDLLRYGYALGGGGFRPPVPEGEEREPILQDLERLKHHFSEGRDRRMAKMSGRLVEEHPDNFAFLVYRLHLMAIAGETTASRPLMDRLLDRYPERQETLHWSAHHAFALGDSIRAAALLEAALEVGPVEGEIYYDLACSRSLQGDVAGALDDLRRAVEAGYRNWQWIESDGDLSQVRADPGYAELMRAYRP